MARSAGPVGNGSEDWKTAIGATQMLHHKQTKGFFRWPEVFNPVGRQSGRWNCFIAAFFKHKFQEVKTIKKILMIV
jgi:hypothetical protein